MDCKTLKGRTSAEVMRLLGRPTSRGEAGWYWEIGPAPGGLDSQQLWVAFGDRRTVERTGLVTF